MSEQQPDLVKKPNTLAAIGLAVLGLLEFALVVTSAIFAFIGHVDRGIFCLLLAIWLAMASNS